jgi:hypothetical protein
MGSLSMVDDGKLMLVIVKSIDRSNMSRRWSVWMLEGRKKGGHEMFIYIRLLYKVLNGSSEMLDGD